MSTTLRGAIAWVVAVVCSLVVSGLIVAAILNLEIADHIASVFAGAAALIGLAISIVTLVRSPAAARTVRAQGQRSIAAGGDIRRNAIGDRSKASSLGPAPTQTTASPSSALPDVQAQGDNAISAGGDITDNAIGEASER